MSRKTSVRRHQPRRWRFPVQLTRLEDRAVPATITWDGGPTTTGTDFALGENWVGDVAPGPTDDASIPVGFSSATIAIGAGYTLNKLTCASSLDITGGTLSLAVNSSITGSLNLNGGGVSNGATTLTVSGGLNTTAGSVNGAVNVSGGGTLSGSVAITGAVNFNAGNFALQNGFSTTGTGSLNLSNSTITVGAAATATVTNFAQTAGTVTGSGELTITGAATFNGGTHSGAGTTSLGSSATSTFTGNSASLVLDGRQFKNAGSFTWTGGGITIDNGSVFDNQSSGLFVAQVANSMFRNSGVGTALFSNAGTFRRSVNPSTTTVMVPFTSTGVVDVLAGTLTFSGAHALSLSGSLAVATTLNLSSSSLTLNDGLAGTGVGTVRFNTGTATIPLGATVTFNNFNHAGGKFTGAGEIVVTNLTEDGGTYSGTGTLTIPAGAKASVTGLSGSMILEGWQVNNASTVTWIGGGITLDNGTVWTNQSGALFDAQAGNSMFRNSGLGTALFSNAGTFRRSANTSTSTISVPFSSTNAVDVQLGVLTFTGASTSFAGTIAVATTMNLQSTSVTFNAGLTESGVGELKLNSGTVTIPSGVVSLQNFNQTGGTVTGAGDLSFANLTQNAGTLSGSGSHIIAFGAKATISGINGATFLAGRQFKNAGTVTWTGSGITLDDGSVFDNQVGAIFDVQTANSITRNSGNGSALFSNSGTFRRSVNTATSTVSIPFLSTGTLDIQTGTQTFNGPTTTLSGVATVAGIVNLSSPTTTLNNGLTESGAGEVRLNSGTATVPTAATISFQNFTQIGGTFTGAGTVTITNLMQNGGTLAGAGSTVIPVGGKANFTGINGTTFLDGRQFKNSSTVTWSGGGITMDNGSVFDNQLGAVFDAQTNSTFSRNSGIGTALISNAGTFKRTVGLVTATISVPFASTGAIDAQTGTITFNGTNTDLAGSVSVAATMILSGAAGTFNNGLTGTGAGELRLASGTITVPTGANVGLQKLNQIGGTITGAGTVTITNLTQNGGTMSGSGSHVIPLGGTVTWSGINGTTLISGRQFSNFGTVTWTALDILMESGAVFTNQAGGLFDAKASASLALNGITTGTFNNAGTFRRSAASGTTTVSASFANTGIVEAQAGTLTFDGSKFTTSGATTVALGAMLKTSSGNFTQTAGSLSVIGTLDPAGLADIKGGVLSGTGTIEANVQNAGTLTPGTSPGKLIVNGNYTQSGALDVELNGLTAGTLYDQVVVNGTVTLGGTLTGSAGFSANIGDTFTIIDNDGSDTISTNFSGLLEGSLIKLSGQFFAVSYKGGTGNDVTLTRSNVNTVLATEINGGQAQRSMVTQLKVTFSTNVSLPSNPEDAFELRRQNDSATVSLNVTLDNSGPGTLATITFNPGTAVQSGSLADGRYTLKVLAAQVNGGAFDGNADGTNGDDYVLASDPFPTTPTNIYRLYGDINGDGFTDNVDLVQYRQANGSDSTMVNYNAGFDSNNDGFIDNIDFIAFRQRLGVTVP